MRKLSKQEAIDIIYGCAVVGTGGGGNLQSGLKMIEECYNQGNVVKMAELKELGDDDFVATPYGCGAPRLLADNTEDPYAGLPRLDYPAPLLAFRTLEEYMGKKILLMLVLIVINGLFSMTEMAVVSLRKSKLQSEIAKGNRKAQAAHDLSEHPSDFFSMIQIAITLAGVVSGAIGSIAFSAPIEAQLCKVRFLAPVADTLSVLIVSILVTYLSLVIGELVPKRIAIAYPEKIAIQVGGFMTGIANVAKPLVRFLSFSSDIGIRLLGVRENSEPPVSEDEVKAMIEQGKQSGVFEETEQDIVESVFRMSDRAVHAMMTPRTDVTWVNIAEPIEDILEEIRASNETYFPVVRDHPDNVLGIVSVKKILDRYISGQEIRLEELIDTPLFLPESTPALSALDSLRESGKQAAIIIDEYGGFSGLVTPVDILEELVGEIPSADDETYEPEIVTREDGSFLIDGGLDIEDMKDMLGVDQLEDQERVDYQTVAGFLLSRFGFIPKAGDTIEMGDYRFEVVDMDGRRIDKVLVDRLPAQDPDSAPTEGGVQPDAEKEDE